MISLTRVYRFSSSHRLHCARLSEQENREVFGKCNNPYGHGHNYVLEVTVGGEIDPTTGLVADVQALDRFVHQKIVARYDHRDMNTDLEEYRDLVPTTENVALQVARRLCEDWKQAPEIGARLERIRIHETNNNIFEVHVS